METIETESRILTPLHFHKKMDLGRGGQENIEMRMDLVGQQTVLSVERLVWAEGIENLEETISIKHPKNMTEHLKCVFYKSLVKDWNHTESLVAWLRDKFPVQYTTISKTCTLKTRVKYPGFKYKPLPEYKFGPHVFETVSGMVLKMAKEEHREE